MGFMDRVIGNIQETAAMAREGVEDFHAKRDLGHAYGELGRKAFELIESGHLTAPELDADADRIRTLKAEAQAEKSAETGS